ncbi:hypothetical protein EMEDMD4_790203 [Sinorhizobium medicae]|uniref:Uncharacterized protein n=1 Tax=Sinorhizobium medicae TaxID=110321 RepID=A0A508X698_9HYPH|nr:hypothetical protein EMEDMD4_790203 [Sinorhizobium medicae]
MKPKVEERHEWGTGLETLHGSSIAAISGALLANQGAIDAR